MGTPYIIAQQCCARFIPLGSRTSILGALCTPVTQDQPHCPHRWAFAHPPWEKSSPPREAVPDYKRQDKDIVIITALGISPRISTTLWSLLFFPFMNDPKDALASKTCIPGLAGQVKWEPIHLMSKLKFSLSFGKVHMTFRPFQSFLVSLSGGQAIKDKSAGAIFITSQNWNLTNLQGLSHQAALGQQHAKLP